MEMASANFPWQRVGSLFNRSPRSKTRDTESKYDKSNWVYWEYTTLWIWHGLPEHLQCLVILMFCSVELQHLQICCATRSYQNVIRISSTCSWTSLSLPITSMAATNWCCVWSALQRGNMKEQDSGRERNLAWKISFFQPLTSFYSSYIIGICIIDRLRGAFCTMRYSLQTIAET